MKKNKDLKDFEKLLDEAIKSARLAAASSSILTAKELIGSMRKIHKYESLGHRHRHEMLKKYYQFLLEMNRIKVSE
ncbi:MAG TPA: hypothetical protein VLY84_00250 [Dysgonamonadaceae bacterium]|nr:hypothetical protein [Dysgonamonadaceae bacterium]